MCSRSLYSLLNALFECVLYPLAFHTFSHTHTHTYSLKPHPLPRPPHSGEEEFLIALDDTQWLYRIQELLQTTAAVVTKLEEEQASVLISYDSGLDRTTQVSY